MNTEDQPDRIGDYLRGDLADREAFERELSANPQLKIEMETTRQALDAITLREEQVLKDRLRNLEAGMATTARQPDAKVIPIGRKRSGGWFAYAAAAALVVFVAGYFLLRPAPATPEQLALSEFEPFTNIAYTVTKGANDGDDGRAAAYAAYETGDYATAEGAFAALGPDDPVDRFYFGQTLLAQEKYASARDLYRELATQTDFNLTQESAYYLALANLGLGQADEAREEIRRIADNADHPMSREARQLLEKL
ncbi:tol-pal system YbgF family protein [Lewinella sp. JB7]|uniref:tetratricopeptide repeat protein n=1 Tax=Lewinella sp. JB7 TaxID=2962887 RepID=UPI0020C99F7B|nr:hypothetical protein [Lewinella sp. JB7]MCP9237038.1 hypothetical protein [Lewinella sp. JB7]